MLKIDNNILFRNIYKQYSALVRGNMYRLCPYQDIDDLVQEVFIKIWKSINDLQDNKKIKGWIYKICYNQSVDYYRKKKPTETQYENSVTQIHESSLEKKLDQHQVIYSALNKLSFEHRSVLNLFIFEELTINEIADITSLPAGTIKSRIHFAKEKIEQFLPQEMKYAS